MRVGIQVKESSLRKLLRNLNLLLDAGIVQAVKAIEDTGRDKNETIAVDLRSAISPDDSGHAAGAEKIKDEFENEITELNNEKLALDTVIQNAESAIDSEYADQDGLIVQYEDAVGDTISEYYALAEKKNTIDNLLGELESEIENKTGRVIQKQTPENIIIEGTDFEKYDTLNRILREFDIDEVNSESIESSVKSVQRARKKQLEAQEKQDSVGESVRSLLGKGTIGGLRSDYDGIKDREIHQDIISISDWSDAFDVVVHAKYFDERREQISNEKDELVGTINNITENILQTAEQLQERPTNWIPDHEMQAQKIAEKIEEPSTSYDRTFISDYLDNNSIVDNNKNPDELLKGPIKQELQEALHEILIKPYETKRSDIQDQVKRVKHKKDKFEKLEDIVKNPGQDYYSVTDDLISVDEIAESEEIEESGNFKIKAKPYSRGKLGGSDDLGDTELWSRDREKRELLSTLEDVAPNMGDDYLPINERYIEDGNTSQVDYDYHKVHSVFSSTIFDEYDDSPSAEIDILSKHFTEFNAMEVGPKNNKEYHATRTTFVDSYDFSFTTFLSGVFLDNLEIFSDVCRDVYETSNEIDKTEGKHHHQDSVPETVRHHTYGIDGLLYHDRYQFFPEESDGGYCYRDTVMNFDTDGAEQLLDNGGDNTTFGEDVREMILEEFYSFVGYPSTIDLE
ncbi:hypothetical protein [Halonotius sp. GCM10025705]|uniref:hypothetical protein n=1 Tax=Halonotius sp. GCM10025705 TaxID=3252678 RepID=UPI0036166047